MKRCFLLVFIIFIVCTSFIKFNKTSFLARYRPDAFKSNIVVFRQTCNDNLFVPGDFDGDGRTDTLIYDNISKISKKPVVNIPDFSEGGSPDKYLDSLKSDLYITLKNKKADTLHLGLARGLFCLINIGDNNNDKRDEIAFVVDYCDFSNCNTCWVYTLCDKRWLELKKFNVHESAFYDEENTAPVFEEIKGYLECRDKKWYYLDYFQWFNASGPQDTIMKPLILKKRCR